MGMPFSSGHVLGLRRWTASSVDQPFTSIWHRRPDGTWEFFERGPDEIACTRWFGGPGCAKRQTDIDLTWLGDDTLRIATTDGSLEWVVTLATSPVVTMMNAMMRMLPMAAWRSPRFLRIMGAMATRLLGVGTVELVGSGTTGFDFIANPLRMWRVVDATATIDGVSLGTPQPLAEQARRGDFWIPQRGIFAMGRVFMIPTPDAARHA